MYFDFIRRDVTESRNRPLISDISFKRANSPIHKLALIAFLASFLLFPTVDVLGVSLPLVLIFGLVCVRFWVPMTYINAGIAGAGILLIFTASNVVRNQGLVLKDYSYWVIPLMYIVIITLAIGLFEIKLGGRQDWFFSFFVLFLLAQLFVASAQLFNVFGINALLEPYFQSLGEHVGAGTVHGDAEQLGHRPMGTVGMSTRLGFIAYLVARVLTSYTDRYRYVGMAVVLAIVSSSRMALVTIAVTETIIILLFENDRLDAGTVLKWGIPAGGLLAALIFFHPFLNQFVYALASGAIVESLTQSYSIQHRIQMFQLLAENPSNIFIGGWVLSEFTVAELSGVWVNAVDTELVMRTLQFGFLGYLAFKLPLFAFALRSYRIGDERMIKVACVFLSVAFLSSLTMTTSSNMYFVYIYSVLIGAAEVASKNKKSKPH